MSENINAQNCFKEATCIDTMKIFDSCSDKDCLENLAVNFTAADQQIVNTACFVKSNCVEIVNVTFTIEPVPFHCGFYAVDITYAFNVYVDVYQSPGAAPQQIQGTSTFTKKVILYGSEGRTKSFYSNEDIQYTPDGCSCLKNSLPIASVNVVDPIVLDIKFTCRPIPTSCSNEECLVCETEPPVVGVKYVYITIGMFSIVQLQRRVPILVPTYDYCIPEKECTSNTDSPCELFDKLNFPVNEFFPKSLDDSGSCGCKSEDNGIQL